VKYHPPVLTAGDVLFRSAFYPASLLPIEHGLNGSDDSILLSLILALPLPSLLRMDKGAINGDLKVSRGAPVFLPYNSDLTVVKVRQQVLLEFDEVGPVPSSATELDIHREHV
jgi:hypothetical protein